MRILCVVNGLYGERIAAHLRRAAPADWDVLSWSGPAHLPAIVDEPQCCLPDALPQAELLITLAESPGLSDLATDLAAMCGARAVIAPVDRYSWLPQGLAGQLAHRCRELGLGFAAPSPFCSLSKHSDGHDLIDAFADHFGLPEFSCEVTDGRIVSTRWFREAPCGNTRFVAERLVGASVGSAVERAGLLHHYYPCLASMEQATAGAHTILHRAAKMTVAAVDRALSRTGLSISL